MSVRISIPFIIINLRKSPGPDKAEIGCVEYEEDETGLIKTPAGSITLNMLLSVEAKLGRCATIPRPARGAPVIAIELSSFASADFFQKFGTVKSTPHSSDMATARITKGNAI